MSYRFLSYILTRDLPVYGGFASIHIDSIKSITDGDSANVFRFTLQNHWGTHVDTPNHFFESGKKVGDYPAEFWFFKSPQVMQINLEPAEILKCTNWIKAISPDADILLFRSGWYKHRGQSIYSYESPGIHPEVGFYLREKYPNIRAIGIDWISISSYKNRDIGREAHKAFLNPEGLNNPVLIIEDMDLSYDLKTLKELWIIPLLVEGLDSAPCTVIGVFK